MAAKKSISLLGYGWLGKQLYPSLIQQGFDLKIAASTPAKMKERQHAGLNAYSVSLGADFFIDQAFFDSQLLIVAIPPRPHLFFDRLLESIQGSKITNVLFVSSTSVYQNVNEVVTEASALSDSFLVKIEKQFSDLNTIKTTIVRFGGLFSKDRHPGNFFKDKSHIDNAGRYVNLIHQDDCINILMQIIEDEIWGETFNACAPSHPTKEEFYSLALRDLNKTLPKIENTGLNGKRVSSKKLIERLGYQFIHADLIEFWNKKGFL